MKSMDNTKRRTIEPEPPPIVNDNYPNLPRPRATPFYNVQRPVITHEKFAEKSGYSEVEKGLKNYLRDFCGRWSCCAFLISIIPIFEWLPKYHVKWLPLDIIAGLVVGVMHIPHGIAYSMMAGVPTQSGLYMAVLPCCMYVLFGTSRHVSMGTYAVASMMTNKVVVKYNTVEPPQITVNTTDQERFEAQKAYAEGGVEVAVALALATGVVQITMAVFQMGVLAALLSEPLISGFLSGCAFHVAASQMHDLLGLDIPGRKDIFKVPLTLKDVALALPDSNWFVCCVSAGTIIYLILANECVRPCIRRCCRFPFPSELIIIVIAIAGTSLLTVEMRHNMALVGNIPSGLPASTVPQWLMVYKVWFDSLPIVVVCYSTVISLGATYGKKYHYQVRPNQELVALAACNVMASFNYGFPVAASLGRSSLIDQAGGKTQITTVVAACLMLIVMLWMGQYFEDLPKCVLSAVIIMALRSNFLQVRDIKLYYREGQLELFTWLVTFLVVVIVDIDIGLYAGVLFSLIALWVNGFRSQSCLLGGLADVPAVYANLGNHSHANEPGECKIFRYAGSLNFATRLFFRARLTNALEIDMDQVQDSSNPNVRFLVLIIDLSMVGFMDISGCRMLHEVCTDMGERNVRVLLANPMDMVYDNLMRAKDLGYGPFDIFPSLHDGVEFAKACRV